MDIEQTIKESLENILIKIGTEFSEVTVEKKDEKTYIANIESTEASILIGHHGETIQNLQHLLKVVTWSQTKGAEEFNVIVDVDGYRQKQEENVINLAERKVDFVRNTGRAQSLPPMSGYFRRIVHMRLMEPEFDDIETESEGERDTRHIIIKPKS
ncbi:KH domain-containing protein [Candidatus Peregrinibacteria bacterium]|jgi:spoIIIJ-associated protein|nr:KH domain-containing protein [Candidatus Peregrinibacteria bacterium]MBT4056005.1 KH domain-containing protein [Candidatus Peregrinibacteria bacterium]